MLVSAGEATRFRYGTPPSRSRPRTRSRWRPDRTQPVRPASDDDEFLPRFTIMEVIPPRCTADAVVQLANWRQRVTSTAPGGTLAEVLQHRPARVVRDAGGARTEHRTPVWANTLVDSLTARQRLISHLQARQIADLAELSAGYPGIHEFLPTEVALALHVTDATASSYLNDARDLTRRLPATFAALDAGRITAVKANAIRAATDHLPPELSAAVEHDVLPRASTQTVPQLRAAVHRAILRRDPTGADQRHRSETEKRRITRSQLPDGMASLWVYAPAQHIAAIDTCLTALTAAARTPDDPRTPDQRRVDTLLDLCTDILTTGTWRHLTLPVNHRRRPHIHVTVPITALHPDTTTPGETADLTGYGPITPAQARAITADGTLRRLLCDPATGALLDYGRTTYRPPAALADHVLTRDNTCIMPGSAQLLGSALAPLLGFACDAHSLSPRGRQPAHHTEIDHRTPYNAGGTTSTTTLGGCCKHHHRAKDGGEYTLTRTADGYEWTTPLGRTYTREPTRLWDPPPRMPSAPPKSEIIDERESLAAEDELPPPF